MGNSAKSKRERRRRDPGAERPDPPWGSLPLSEILVLSGIVFLAWGLFGENPASVAVGLGLASLGGLELSVREHFSGYRSHTALLASAPGLVALGLSYYLTGLDPVSCLVIAVAVGLAAAVGLRRVFRRASGGFSMRIGGFRR